jgi:hypothetical protein
MKPDTSISSPDRSAKPLAQAVDAIHIRRYALPKVRLLLKALKTGLALRSECHLMGSASSC